MADESALCCHKRPKAERCILCVECGRAADRSAFDRDVAELRYAHGIDDEPEDPIADAVRGMLALPAHDFMEAMAAIQNARCIHCGGEPRCQCWNDE